MAELRVGALPVPAADRRPARAGRSRIVTHQRLVAVAPAPVQVTVERFMRTQMFELRRRAGDRSLYRPRSDLVASLRRGLDFAGAIKLDGLRTVSVTAIEADDRTLVRVEAELTASRANAVAGGAAAGTTVALLTGLTGRCWPSRPWWWGAAGRRGRRRGRDPGGRGPLAQAPGRRGRGPRRPARPPLAGLGLRRWSAATS